MTRSELTFSFQPVTKEQITNLIRLLNNKKAIQSTDIPTKLIKEYCVFFSEFIHKDINLYTNTFLEIKNIYYLNRS